MSENNTPVATMAPPTLAPATPAVTPDPAKAVVSIEPPPAKVELPTGDRVGHAAVSMTYDDPVKTDFTKVIPEEYKDKPWVQNLLKNDNPQKEFFKQYEEAQKLIGSRPQGIVPPNENSTPEQRKEFYKALGVPDDIKAYIVDTQWDEAEKAEGELIALSRREDTIEEMRKTAQAEGLTPKQFKAMVNKWEKSQVKVVRELKESQTAQQTKQNAEFNEKLKAQFGDRADNVIINGKNLIEKYVPESIRKELKTLDNSQAMVLASALDSIHSNLVKGETFSGTNAMDSGVVAPIEDMKSIRQQTRELMSSKAFTDIQHADHKATLTKVRGLQDSLKKYLK
jgi:hypothetical protein